MNAWERIQSDPEVDRSQIYPVLCKRGPKRLQALWQEALSIPISKPSFRRNSYKRGLTEKKPQAIKFARQSSRQYRISHCKSPSIELFLIFFMYLFLSSKSLPLLRHLARCKIHHISMPCRSRVHRDGGLKANHGLLAFGITI